MTCIGFMPLSKQLQNEGEIKYLRKKSKNSKTLRNKKKEKSVFTMLNRLPTVCQQ